MQMNYEYMQGTIEFLKRILTRYT